MQDIRDAFRTLRATPGVCGVAVLSLALGIGANTAMFSILDSLLLRALPVRQPDRLAIVMRGSEGRFSSWTNPIWEQIRNRDELFDSAFAWSSTRFNLSQAGETQFVDGLWVSGRFFETLGVPAILGRTLTPEDDRRGGGPHGPAAMISYNLWQRRFGGAADAIGASLTVERVPFTVVGVTPPGFFGVDVGRTFDVVIPIGTEPLVRLKDSALDRRSTWWMSVMVRLKDGQPIESAQAALRGVQPQIREATMPPDTRYPERYLNEPFTLRPAATGQSGLRTRYRQPLVALMIVVGLVLLVACANIANLLLARATARRHEFAVRVALGAGRFRLARQLLAESLMLSAAGAALGLLVAQWGSRVLVRQLSTRTNFVFLDLSLDWRVLGFTVAVAVLTALLFGVVPALRASRAEPVEALREQGRGTIGEGRIAFGSVLVAVQVALSLMLVVAAGLFVRTFVSLVQQRLGFDRDRILVVSVNARNSGVEPAARADLYERLRQSAASVPGVAHAAASDITPVSGSTWNSIIEVENGPALLERDRESYVNAVTPEWFATYGTKLTAGRDFDVRDRTGAPPVVIVNETFVKKFLAGGPPLGRRIRFTPGPMETPDWMEVIGVATDAVYRSLREPVPATMYLPLAQRKEPWSSINVGVRAAGGSPALLTKSVAAAMMSVDANIALTFRPLADHVDAALTQERIVAMLSGFFGGLALLLAGLGLYGVTSYAVSRRRTEIGIRMALGAEPGRVVRMVLSRVALLVAIGIVAGAAVALWASKFAAALVYGLQPRDPATVMLAAVVLSTVGALAGWLPAQRAARIDPARVLRQE